MAEFTIRKEDMPTQLFSVTFKEPTFQEFCELRSRYLGANSNRRLNYSEEELLFAYCLTHIDGVIPAVQTKDPVDKLAHWDIADSQFALATFLATCYLDNEGSNEARRLALDLKKSSANQFTITRQDLPSGAMSATFVGPNFQLRRQINEKYERMAASNHPGYELQEFLFAHCLRSINGIDLPAVEDRPMMHVGEWSLMDMQFATQVFLNMFTIDKDAADYARSLGKSLRAGASSTPDSTTGRAASKSKATASEAASAG